MAYRLTTMLDSAKMELKSKLLNNWIEYTGGSRPKTNFIRFQDMGERGFLIALKYVFDWNTKEVVNLQFFLTNHDFDELVTGLVERGNARIDRMDDIESLSFEWFRDRNEYIQFRLNGVGSYYVGGRGGYQMRDFERLLLESSSKSPGL